MTSANNRPVGVPKGTHWHAVSQLGNGPPSLHFWVSFEEETEAQSIISVLVNVLTAEHLNEWPPTVQSRSCSAAAATHLSPRQISVAVNQYIKSRAPSLPSAHQSRLKHIGHKEATHPFPAFPSIWRIPGIPEWKIWTIAAGKLDELFSALIYSPRLPPHPSDFSCCPPVSPFNPPSPSHLSGYPSSSQSISRFSNSPTLCSPAFSRPCHLIHSFQDSPHLAASLLSVFASSPSLSSAANHSSLQPSKVFHFSRNSFSPSAHRHLTIPSRLITPLWRRQKIHL